MKDLLQRIAHLPPDKRKLVMKKLRDQGLLNDEAEDGERIQPAPADVPIPLSYSQLRMWMMLMLGGIGRRVSANIDVALRLRGTLHRAALEQTGAALMRRHQSLRTVFLTDQGEALQVVKAELSMPLVEVDLTALPADLREANAQEIVLHNGVRPMDLYDGPLVQAVLIRLSPDQHLLAFALCHLISDGWSVGVLSRDFVAIYSALCQGKPDPLPEPQIQFTDYAYWQRQYLQGETLARYQDFWRNYLEKADDPLELPVDKQPKPGQPVTRLRYAVNLGANVTRQIGGLTKDEGASIFMFLVAAFKTLLHRYSGGDFVRTGTLIAGRNRPETQDLIGALINTGILRTNLGGNPSFREVLQRVKESTLAFYAHQELPYEKVLEALGVKPEMNMPTLFKVMVVLQNIPMKTVQLPGLEVTLNEDQRDHALSNTDLSLLMAEREEELYGYLEYNPHVFNQQTISVIADQFKTMVAAAVAQPDQPVETLPVMTQAERHYLLKGFNETQAAFPDHAVLATLFEEQVRSSPDAVAVSLHEERLTYRELNARANRLAHFLRTAGVKADQPVGLMLLRKPMMLVALWGVLKAGGAYLPINPDNPPERIAAILNDAGAELLLTEEVLRSRLESSDIRTIILDAGDDNGIAGYPDTNPTPVQQPENLAYIITTSGSTGRPKGVGISQRALIQYALAAVDLFEISPQDRVLQFAALSFDTAAEEIFPCHLRGAQLVLRNDDMLSSMEVFLGLCAHWGVTLLDLPTAWWHAMVDQLEDLDLPRCLRLVIIGGEAADPARVIQWREHCDIQIPLFNTYGPTETTVVATAVDLAAYNTFPDMAPIGSPVANTSAYVVRDGLEVVGPAAAGELLIGGEGLARGYLGLPSLTARHFIPDPFATQPGSRLYRTGDRVRYLPENDGQVTLQFIGRQDHQVKVRGFRVELGEVEAWLRRHVSIREAVVVSLSDASGMDHRLVAYVTPGDEAPDAAILRQFIHDHLPDYMVPTSFVVLAEFPLTTSGKIDRKALPKPREEDELGGESFVAPETELEIAVAEIWQEVLNREKVGLFDNFFDIGGNSLLSTQVLYRIKKMFEVDLPLHRLFEDPTVANLALTIEEIILEEIEAEEEV